MINPLICLKNKPSREWRSNLDIMWESMKIYGLNILAYVYTERTFSQDRYTYRLVKYTRNLYIWNNQSNFYTSNDVYVCILSEFFIKIDMYI